MTMQNKSHQIASLGLAAMLGCAATFTACGQAFDNGCRDTLTCSNGGGAGTGGNAAGGTGSGGARNNQGGGLPSGGSTSDGGSSSPAAGGAAIGASGAVGEGGAGGVGGASCGASSDCDDGLACNGVEICDAGLCRPGTPACAALPGCSATCTETVTGAKCTQAPEDRDGDGHVAPDNKCPAATTMPKDDCDDAQPTVYGGALEICDGLDNDCDGLDDFSEGLPLGGQIRTVVPAATNSGDDKAVAWSPALRVYGLVWATRTTVFFLPLSPSGEALGQPRELIADGMDHTGTIAVDWSGDTLGLAWMTTMSGGSSSAVLTFARFQVAGPQMVPHQLDATPIALNDAQSVTGVAHAENGGWLVLGQIGDAATAFRLSDKGALIPPATGLGDTSWFNGVASSGEEAAAYWFRAEGSGASAMGYSLQFARWKGKNMAQTLPPTTIIEPTANYWGGTAAAAGLSDGFFLVSRSKTQKIVIARRGVASTSSDCGPVELSAALPPFAVDGEIRASANDTWGFYVSMLSPSQAMIGRLPLDCDVNRVAQGTTDLDLGEAPDSGGVKLALSSNPGGHLVVWSKGTTIRARAFGNSFCNSPE